MIADGHLVGDGSWELKVLVTDLSVERCLRVKGDLHIGGVMLRLVEELGMQLLLFVVLVCPYLGIQLRG
jgi:kindlin 2